MVQIILPTSMIAPPPSPGTAREALNIPTLCEHADNADPTVNTTA